MGAFSLVIDANTDHEILTSSLRSPGEQLQCLQYKAIEISSPAVGQDSGVYEISMPKCLNFITYFNRRLAGIQFLMKS